MNLIHPQLAAFVAIVENGSFDAAARNLCITSSAVSQRLKTLEDRLGQVLIVRQPPCRPTPAGELLLRRVRPMQILEAEALADFHLDEDQDDRHHLITIAVNSDSLATWFLEALSRLNQKYGYLFDVQVDDQEHTLDLLRNGSVLGAVTSEASPIQGCTVETLGAMRYQAIASPNFVAQHFPQGVNTTALAQAPMIVFNRKDDLQWRFIQQITHTQLSPPIHYLPTPTGFVDAAALGLGWCLAPDLLLESALKKGSIVLLAPHLPIDVPLYWQHASIRSDTLENIRTTLRQTASNALHNIPQQI